MSEQLETFLTAYDKQQQVLLHKIRETEKYVDGNLWDHRIKGIAIGKATKQMLVTQMSFNLQYLQLQIQFQR